jgi:hypothetical protein
MTRYLVPVALLMAVPTNAQAGEIGSMWGVGAHMGGRVIPFAYPLAFPKSVRSKNDFSLEKARTNFNFGIDGLVYINNTSRLFLEGNVDGGKGFSDINAIGGYEIAVVKGTVDLIAGGGIGIGGMGFRGVENGGSTALDDDDGGGGGGGEAGDSAGGPGGDKLRVTYFPLRAQLSALYRQDVWALQLTLYGELGIPGRHVYTSPNGDPEDVNAALSFVNYPSIGLEITGFYGDFKLRDKKKKGKKGKKGKK